MIKQWKTWETQLIKSHKQQKTIVDIKQAICHKKY